MKGVRWDRDEMEWEGMEGMEGVVEKMKVHN